MRLRKANSNDLDLLTEWNHQLIEDEGHRNPMTVPELKERMKDWLSKEYQAFIFLEAEDQGYALFREDSNEIYLRQFFIRRDQRRKGLGKKAMDLLIQGHWSPLKRLTVEVLTKNKAGIEFWRSVGYSDYCLKLEIPRRTNSNNSVVTTPRKRSA